MRKFLKIRYLIVFALFFTAVFYAHKGVSNLLKSSYFNVKNVTLNGLINADSKKVDKFCKNMIGKNIFEINLETAEQISDEWIRQVIIKKIYPSDIEVYVYEKVSVFEFIKGRRQYHYLSDNSLANSKKTDAGIFVTTKYWKENLKHFQKFAKEEIITSADRIELKDSYISVSKNGTEMKIPYDFEIYSTALKYIKSVLGRYKSVKYIDLRIKNRIYADGVKI